MAVNKITVINARYGICHGGAGKKSNSVLAAGVIIKYQ